MSWRLVVSWRLFLTNLIKFLSDPAFSVLYTTCACCVALELARPFTLLSSPISPMTCRFLYPLTLEYVGAPGFFVAIVQ